MAGQSKEDSGLKNAQGAVLTPAQTMQEVESFWRQHWPSSDLLADFLNKIEEGSSWPKALRQWRQIHMNKPGKAPGVLENLRPISVGAAVYRLWSATRVCQLGPWLRRRFPNQVHGGLPARGVRAALLSFLAELEVAQRTPRGNLRYVGASDLSKAFDAMHGALAVRALSRLGVPEPLCRAWQQAWGQQERVLQIAGLCSKQVVTQVECLPQGDPASPAGLTAPLVESLRRISRKFSGNGKGRCIFIGSSWTTEVGSAKSEKPAWTLGLSGAGKCPCGV